MLIWHTHLIEKNDFLKTFSYALTITSNEKVLKMSRAVTIIADSVPKTSLYSKVWYWFAGNCTWWQKMQHRHKVRPLKHLPLSRSWTTVYHLRLQSVEVSPGSSTHHQMSGGKEKTLCILLITYSTGVHNIQVSLSINSSNIYHPLNHTSFPSTFLFLLISYLLYLHVVLITPSYTHDVPYTLRH